MGLAGSGRALDVKATRAVSEVTTTEVRGGGPCWVRSEIEGLDVGRTVHVDTESPHSRRLGQGKGAGPVGREAGCGTRKRSGSGWAGVGHRPLPDTEWGGTQQGVRIRNTGAGLGVLALQWEGCPPGLASRQGPPLTPPRSLWGLLPAGDWLPSCPQQHPNFCTPRTPRAQVGTLETGAILRPHPTPHQAGRTWPAS